MSGWDVSSTPTWGSEDGPEDTQGFRGQGDGSRDFGQEYGAQDFGRGGPSSPPAGFPEVGGGFPGESPVGGPPPEFFGQDYDQDQDSGPAVFPKRTPGRSLQDLPRRDPRSRPTSVPSDSYGQGNGYGQEPSYGGQGNGYAQEPSYGGQDNGHPQEPSYAQESSYGRDNAYGQEGGAFGQDWGGSGADQADGWGANGQEDDGGWGRPAGRSAAPWEEPSQQGPGYGDADGPGFGQQDFGGQDYTRQAPRPGFIPNDNAGQDFPGQDFPGQEVGPQEMSGFNRQDRDTVARMDPALQDFFAPQRGGGSGGYPDQGRPGEPRDPRYRPSFDGWDEPGRSQAPRNGTGPRSTGTGPRPTGTGPRPMGTGPRPMPRGPRRDDPDPEPRRGLGTRGLIAIGAVVAVIIVIGVVVFMHKSGGTPTASNTPAASTAPAAKPSAGTARGTGSGTAAGGGATTAAYTLSTPATAGGYPMGQDPHFLATATATAKQISAAVTTGGGGTVKGNPVSAAYQLPASQVITFVGYQGTFTPAKVETILGSLGSDPHTYPAGANGGILGCANSTTTPSGAVCVWATSSTLGITEFYTATGPETLNAAQSKGADDTVKLRAGVEKKA